MTLDDIRLQCENCRRCELCGSRQNVVFGARIMFVGEAPGRTEDEQGMPFVGRAGALLDTLLIAAGLDRSQVYIANILKCRPPQNRDPLPAEQDACLDWLRAQFRCIDPRVVVCLGRIAAKKMIDPDFLITRDHGKVWQKGGVAMIGTFHPAALLRNPANKPVAFADIKIAIAQSLAESSPQ